MSTERDYLETAMKAAQQAYEGGTYPIGAVIVDPNGVIIGQGYNQVYSRGDYTSHAEMEAIRNAGHKLMEDLNFEACTLYTTMEPCLMCCGAILIARIKRVIWVIDDDLYGFLRRLCKNAYHPSAAPQKKESEISIPENRMVSEENSDAEFGHSGLLQGRCELHNLDGEEISPLSILPTGYTKKIASLSILSAGESDLAQSMKDWMEKWNAAKEDRLSLWRYGKMECCERNYIESMERKILEK